MSNAVRDHSSGNCPGFTPDSLLSPLGHHLSLAKIIKKARKYVRTYGTRDPELLARELGVRIHDADFENLKGVYKVILRNPFIFIKKDLDPIMRKIVLLHELGHHALHRREAQIFQEFSLFTDMTINRMEFEANLFAAEISLPDEEILDYI